MKLSRALAGGLLLAVLPLHAWADPTLREALDRAWERATQGRAAEARRGEAEASKAIADGWFPEPPSLAVAEKNDRLNKNEGIREREVELTLPLWVPGQRKAHQAFAAKDAADAQAAIAAARLAIAGELRTSIWNVALARSELEIARERLVTAEKLAADIARRERVGDLARTDLLLAKEEALAAKIALAEAGTREQQALERYRVLTGFDRLPVPIEEVVAAPTTAEHPRLRLARTAVERARAEMQVAHEDRRNPPELSLGLLQARDGFGAANVNTVRIGIRIPFASEARNAPKIAAANSGLIRAEAEYRQVVAELAAAQREAQVALDNAEAAHQAAQVRAGLASERLALQEKAFALGELGLAEFMRVRAAANEARLDLLRATHALAAARAQVNQARGILP
ncbi:TolC family protein [Sulfuricystis multivorans]|uniref:TolC family protein n=1 Tax=Sulfuricystis multivorans TaxID=2211108 RepID=UPI001558D423|nr:TolC family protein [Sulfuricystis multivorans]